MKVSAAMGSCLLALAPFFVPDGLAEDTAPAEVGLGLGERAPAFTLKDQNGKEVSLEALLRKGPVALVFYRSAGWCLFCKFEITQIQRQLSQFEATGGQVVGISYDSIPVIKKFSQSQKITLPLLSDEGSKTIDAYRVRDPEATDPKEVFSVHASFVIDQTGMVRAKLLDVIYQEQPGVGILVKALKEARASEAGTKPSQPEPASSGGNSVSRTKS